MMLPLFAGLLFAPQALGNSDAFTLSSGPNEALLKNGAYFQYVRTIERELIQSPSDAGLHASLGLGYYLLGQRKFCDEEIRQALALLKESPQPAAGLSAQVHYLAGRLSMENAKHTAAILEFQAALASDPGNSKIEYFLGECLQAINNTERARSYFQHACRPAVVSWPCRALADIELDDRNATAAKEHAAQAIQIEPASKDAQLTAGKAAQALGDTPAALGHFRKAVELDQSWEVPHYFLGQLYRKMPGMDKAATHELAIFQELYDAGQ